MNEIKFLLTGPQRSGTTYMASILNSQQSAFCVEDNPFNLDFSMLNTETKRNIFFSRIESNFNYLGINPPRLRQIKDEKEFFDEYFNHLKKVFKVPHIGFKATCRSINQINDITRLGFKIIIMRREIENIFISHLNRIDYNPERSAIHIRQYLNSINHWNIDEKEGILIVDFEELLSSPNNVLKIISDFLGFEIIEPSIRYHSFNKGRKEFISNSSFGNVENRTKNLKNIDSAIKKYYRYINYVRTGKSFFAIRFRNTILKIESLFFRIIKFFDR